MKTSLSKARRTTRAKLAPAFVVTVGLALHIAGCGGNVDDGSGPGLSGVAGASGTGGSTGKGGSGGVNDPACPASQPYGGDCVGSMVCTYPNGSCGPSTSSCVGGKWNGGGVSCNPPPPACPDGDIVEGATCPGGGFGRTTCPRTVGDCKVLFVCDGTWKKETDSCATCPASMPDQGVSCPRDGLACKYPAATSYNCVDARCIEGAWQISSCPQPPPPCPSAPPQAGGGCTNGPGGPTQCSYDVGACVQQWQCGPAGWGKIGESCDEPAPPTCMARLDEPTCAEDLGCRWLWPGCADGMQTKLGQAGCFDAKDCEKDSDCPGDGATCKTVVTDPCHDKPCAACGQESRICQ